MPEPDEFLDVLQQIVDSIRTVTDMFFLEKGYGTPAESYALAHRIVQQMVDEGNLIDSTEVGGA